jgi:hypothetical protein
MKVKRMVTIAIVVLLSILLISAIGCGGKETAPAPEEYKTYSKYGFSFEYPKYLSISEEGLLENEANNSSGIVYGTLENDKLEDVSIAWMKMVTPPTLENSMEDAFREMEGSEGVTIVRGDLEETTKAGHRMIYQYFTATSEGEEANGIWGLWYCSNSQRLYQLGLIYSEQDTLECYQRYLDSSVCH